MAGFTDTAFRIICIRSGAALVFTEMVSAEAVTRGNRKTFDLLQRGREEQFWGIQLFGSDAGVIAKAISIIRSANPSVIDLNCGCSVPKVIKTGSGAALLKNPGKLYSIVLAMTESAGIPVSVKIRSGWDAASINFTEIGKAAEEAGASAVMFHPRTKSQGFSGRASWNHIALLKKCLKIPVIGSGDVFSRKDADKMFKETSADGVLIARGAIGNPFIFDKKYNDKKPDYNHILFTALEHVKTAVQYKGEYRACRDLRKHITAYSKGLPESASFRNRIVHASSLEDYEKIIKEYAAQLNTGSVKFLLQNGDK